MDIKNIRESIEQTLNNFLPVEFNKEWKSLCFGSIPVAVNDTHIKVLTEPCHALLSLGGKRWRPVLQVLCTMMVANSDSARTTNGSRDDCADALGSGTTYDAHIAESLALTPLVEFVHTASLIHDDIEDGADTRRGKPAAHITYGLDTALNAASWLYFTAPTAIEHLDINIEKKNFYYTLFNRELRRLHLGQAMDILWHRNPDIFPTMAEYQAMVQNKTGTLACLAVSVGILAGGGTMGQATQAGEIARGIGEGFQILDDVQNLTTGNPGKKRGDDIVEGKKSLPVLMHISENPQDKEKIANCFQKAQKEGIISESVEECISILEKGNCIKKAFDKGRLLVKEKTQELINMFESSEPHSDAANEITSLFDAMLPRI
ncbi:polyprenyl synthetase family protein [Treponema sp.]|uniref:FPP/GGPP synthase family protein n=1 Tax=Treponema sp. TaxID=166 RepID=UPI00298E3F96|nr:polyprenyl synthetase family protein [Treponema sp.]MCR5613101.1 polyprenyl synthetase family protein [Treponema sp.]